MKRPGIPWQRPVATVSAWGLSQTKELRQVLRRAAQRAGQTQLRDVMRKYAVDVILACDNYRLLSLHDLEIVADSCLKTLTGQVEILLTHLNVFQGKLDLARRGLQIEISISDFAFDSTLQIVEFGPPLSQSSVDLFEVSFGAAALP